MGLGHKPIMSDPNAKRVEGYGSKEVSGPPVVARGGAAEVLEFVEDALHDAALLVDREIDRALGRAIRLG